MKLKTLKDIDFQAGLKKARIRAEAIKWLTDKERYEKFDHSKNYWRWIFMRFHNITEVDLE